MDEYSDGGPPAARGVCTPQAFTAWVRGETEDNGQAAGLAF